MSDPARRRELRDALAAALSEQAGAARYQRYQYEVRRGRERASEKARPQEFDASGFPIPQRTRDFVERVAQLLKVP